MKIADNVEMLEISMNMGGEERIFYPTLIWDDNNLILVDTGFPGASKKILDAITKAGAAFDTLNKIIITHQDIDHIGGIPDILNESSHKILVLSHEDDKPYIQGEKKLDKLTPERKAQLEEQIKSMPDNKRKMMLNLMHNPPKVKVDETLKDGMELPYCGGITIIHTPGHTPGHICLYLKQSKILIAGDLLHVKNWKLMGPDPMNTPNMTQATASLKKLLSFDIDKIVSYHGGLYTSNPNRKIAELVKQS
jgi:glyoxylase-like metal-dependent hydrolase (beta-lactamase superfamily II)